MANNIPWRTGYYASSNPACVAVGAAIDFLAGRCDYASKRDDVGFNGRDAVFGHSLAMQGIASWTPRQYNAAWKMLRTYKNTQLPQVGISYDDLLPRIPDPATRYAAGFNAATKSYAVWYDRDIVVSGIKTFAEAAAKSERWNELMRVSTGAAKPAPVVPAVTCTRCGDTGMIGEYADHATVFCACDKGAATAEAVYAEWDESNDALIRAERGMSDHMAGFDRGPFDDDERERYLETMEAEAADDRLRANPDTILRCGHVHGASATGVCEFTGTRGDMVEHLFHVHSRDRDVAIAMAGDREVVVPAACYRCNGTREVEALNPDTGASMGFVRCPICIAGTDVAPAAPAPSSPRTDGSDEFAGITTQDIRDTIDRAEASDGRAMDEFDNPVPVGRGPSAAYIARAYAELDRRVAESHRRTLADQSHEAVQADRYDRKFFRDEPGFGG